MGLFSKTKKPKDQNAAQDVQTASPAPAPEGKKAKPAKKRKSELLKVLDESVWESVHEDFKANDRFIITDSDGQNKYIGLLFDTNSIGGLAGKDAKKDESKGSIIEAIRTGRIKTYIRAEMLMDNLFIIIPDADTIENMDEFAMLTGAEYTLCSVNDEGLIMTETVNGTDDEDDPEVVVKFEQVADVVSGNADILSLLPAYSSGSNSSAAADDSDDDILADSDDEITDLGDDDDLDDLPNTDDFSDLEDISDDDDNTYDTASADAGDVDILTDDVNSGDAEAVTDDADANADDNGGYDEFEDVTEDVVQDFVVRKFYSDDLGLEVSTLPFDVQFMHGNSYLPFNEDRGTGWLNEYLSNIAKDANTRMERMHNENLFRMRERYMRLIQSQCESIAKQLDISTADTHFGRLKAFVEQNRDDNMNSVDSAVRSKSAQLEELWNRKLEDVGDAAKQEAINKYIEKFGAAHQRDIERLKTYEIDEIEREYQNQLRRINNDRRMEATKLLDVAINATLKEIAEVYLKVLREEKREYIRLQHEMTRFIDDNRKDEKARIEALAEENRQVKKANEVRRDYTSKIKAMSAEFDMNRAALQADIDRINHEHERELESRKNEWAAKLNAEQEKNKELQIQVDSLLEKYANLDDKKHNEYAERIASLNGIVKSKDEEIDHIVASHKRSNTITVMLTVAILIASLGVGFMFGSIVNVRKTSATEVQSIYQQQYQEQQAAQQSTGVSQIPLQ
jgi:hypothetical protein